MTESTRPTYRRWLLLTPSAAPRLRLFCFPFAGGGASVYRTWPQELPEGVDVCPVQLPGRESRRNEPAFDRIKPLVEVLARELRPLMDVPFAIFGHSMGALIGFELARELRRSGGPMPVHLFASGHRGPRLPDPDPPMHDLPEAELLARMAELNGTPKDVIENLELMRLFIPLMRSDAALCETYTHVEEPPLVCGLTVYGGLEDPKATREELDAWRAETAGGFRVQMFPGDHFFLTRDRLPVLRALGSALRGLTPA